MNISIDIASTSADGNYHYCSTNNCDDTIIYSHDKESVLRKTKSYLKKKIKLKKFNLLETTVDEYGTTSLKFNGIVI